MELSAIVEVFNSLFVESFNTRVVGGFDEPYYRVAEVENGIHEIQYREDFTSSALHEIAHWCLAGQLRRQQNDYGYWYHHERDSRQQIQFEQVEAKPQALEWILSVAADVQFQVSCDNIEAANIDTEKFKTLVRVEAMALLNKGLQGRTNYLASKLGKVSGISNFCSCYHYSGLPQ
ncbi:MAG: elongation factor P hydroxylase [Pseudomonadales bacterium]